MFGSRPPGALLCLCSGLALLMSPAGSASAQSVSGTTLNLFNGVSLLGWNPSGVWVTSAATFSTNGGGNRYILTAVPFADFSLQFDYNESGPAHAALRFWAAKTNTGGFKVDLDNSGAAAGVGGIEGAGRSKLLTVAEGWHRVSVEANGGRISVQIDNMPVAQTSNVGSRAGYLGFEASGAGTLQIRGVRLTSMNLNVGFNGSDLSGWKSIATNPAAPSGVGHKVEKTMTLGLGGGKEKPHSGNWSVRGGALHGESGPGGLESSSIYDDVLLHLTATVSGSSKRKEDFAGILVRNTAGQLQGGYPLGLGPYSGQIAGLAARPPAPGNTVDQTVVMAGRTTAIWIGPNLATVYTDSRPESASVGQGAKTSAGPLTIVLPNDKTSIDMQKLAVSALPKVYGLAAGGAPAVLPQQTTTQQTQSATVPASSSAAETAIVQQQQAAAKAAAAAQADKQRTASLMSQALAANDPSQQMALYGQVVQIDPSNAAAVQGFKEAQGKVQAQQASQQNAEAAQENEQKAESTRDQQTNESLSKAQTSFLAGHLGEASTALMVAERLAPGNPLARDLRSRISAATSLRQRLYFLGGGAGLLGIAGLFSAWIYRRKQQKYPVLALSKGLDSGKTYPIEKDVVRIGAVAQDGGQKNDIVVRDVEHTISRFHCEIQRRDGQLYVTDLKSSNGTRLNGKKLEPGRPALLRKGAKIDLGGSVEMQFSYSRRRKDEGSS